MDPNSDVNLVEDVTMYHEFDDHRVQQRIQYRFHCERRNDNALIERIKIGLLNLKSIDETNQNIFFHCCRCISSTWHLPIVIQIVIIHIVVRMLIAISMRTSFNVNRISIVVGVTLT